MNNQGCQVYPIGAENQVVLAVLRKRPRMSVLRATLVLVRLSGLY